MKLFNPRRLVSDLRAGVAVVLLARLYPSPDVIQLAVTVLFIAAVYTLPRARTMRPRCNRVRTHAE